MVLRVRLEQTGGGTATLSLKGEKVERELGAKTFGRLFCDRDEVNNTTLTETEDEVYLEDTSTSPNTDLFGGVLRDVKYPQNPVRGILVFDSFEEYARRSEPTTGANVYQNVTDQTVVEDAVDRVSKLSQGSINQTTTGLDFRFNFASPARMIRKVTERTGSNVQYQPDKTVDFVAQRGADKTGTTLSPSNQNLKDVTAENFGANKKITHVLALGESRGDDQLSARVTASSYSSGDEKWAQVTFKDITSLSELRRKGQSWVDTLDTDYVQVKGTVFNNTVDLGDKFTINYPEKGINNVTLRAARTVRIRDAEGLRYECRFNDKGFVEQAKSSNKTKMDLERYNRAAGGYKGVNRRSFIQRRLATREI